MHMSLCGFTYFLCLYSIWMIHVGFGIQVAAIILKLLCFVMFLQVLS